MSNENAPYLGNRISLISNSKIRYEGILHTVDSRDRTVALVKVKVCGTEGRQCPHEVLPRDKIYDYIIFRANDIEHISIPEANNSLPNDPAIISHSLQADASQASGQNSLGYFCNLPPVSHYQQGTFPFQHLYGSMHSGAGILGSRLAPTSQQQVRSKSPVADAGVQVPASTSAKTKEEATEPKINITVTANPIKQSEESRNYEGQPQRGYGRQPYRGRGRRSRGRRNNFGQRAREPLKFDGEYDFEQANEEFKQLESKIAEIKLEGSGDAQNIPDVENDISYDRQKSFFDNISCEASRVAKGIPRFNWRVERKLNVETFGVMRSNAWQRHRRGRGAYRRGAGRSGFTAADSPKTVTFADNEDVVAENSEVIVEPVKAEDIPTVEIVVEQ